MNPISYPMELRGRWYLAVDKYGKSVKETCSLFGISRQTYYKWYALDHNRYLPNYRPRKQQPNTKLTSEVKQIIEQEKIKINYGPLKMKLLLKAPVRAGSSNHSHLPLLPAQGFDPATAKETALV